MGRQTLGLFRGKYIRKVSKFCRQLCSRVDFFGFQVQGCFDIFDNDGEYSVVPSDICGTSGKCYHSNVSLFKTVWTFGYRLRACFSRNIMEGSDLCALKRRVVVFLAVVAIELDGMFGETHSGVVCFQPR